MLDEKPILIKTNLIMNITKILIASVMAGTTAILTGCGSGSSKNGDTETDSTAVSEIVETTASVELVKNETENKVDVLFDGELFTSYIYPDNMEKPVLFPIITKAGNKVTRAYPLEKKEGERVDHMHHVGHWLNYGDVNGLDFWNNSAERSAEDKDKYGSIRHKEIKNISSSGSEGTLEVTTEWQDNSGKVLLDETTGFVFHNEGDTRYFDRTTTLTAREEEVKFTDNKEGMIAIRVTRAMELPSDQPAVFTDAEGNKTEVKALNNEGVSGNYLSSEGIEGGEVWGTRASWVTLYGEMEGSQTSITIFDHPNNVGYPTYWHARGYGLFAANPLGQKIFSDGKEELNFALAPGESVTFTYRVMIHSGNKQSKEQLDEIYNSFAR